MAPHLQQPHNNDTYLSGTENIVRTIQGIMPMKEGDLEFISHILKRIEVKKHGFLFK